MRHLMLCRARLSSLPVLEKLNTIDMPRNLLPHWGVILTVIHQGSPIHYRESREVKYYADLLNLTPKYLARVVRTTTNGLLPAKWIEQYVTAQAKRLIEARATQTLQETAYMLGFTEPTSFYRYFKRVVGMTAKQYRDSF